MAKENGKIPIKERTNPDEFRDNVKQYTHEDKKRSNNPQVGLVTADTDQPERKESL